MEKIDTKLINLSDNAYNDFYDLLEANDIEPKVVRIALAGFGCSGPRFGLMMDKPTEDDFTETIKDITFVVSKELYSEYEGFNVLSDEENFGGGMSLTPVKVLDSGCSSCAVASDCSI